MKGKKKKPEVIKEMIRQPGLEGPRFWWRGNRGEVSPHFWGTEESKPTLCSHFSLSLFTNSGHRTKRRTWAKGPVSEQLLSGKTTTKNLASFLAIENRKITNLKDQSLVKGGARDLDLTFWQFSTKTFDKSINCNG